MRNRRGLARYSCVARLTIGRPFWIRRCIRSPDPDSRKIPPRARRTFWSSPSRVPASGGEPAADPRVAPCFHGGSSDARGPDWGHPDGRARTNAHPNDAPNPRSPGTSKNHHATKDHHTMQSHRRSKYEAPTRRSESRRVRSVVCGPTVDQGGGSVSGRRAGGDPDHLGYPARPQGLGFAVPPAPFDCPRNTRRAKPLRHRSCPSTARRARAIRAVCVRSAESQRDRDQWIHRRRLDAHCGPVDASGRRVPNGAESLRLPAPLHSVARVHAECDPGRPHAVHCSRQLSAAPS